MKWNDESGYITFQSSLSNLKSFLGVTCLDLVERCELTPYYTYILKYLSDRLILLGNQDMKVRIQEIMDIFSSGTDKIISGSVLDLAWELGIETTDIYLPGREIPYTQDYLIFCWSNALTSLINRLKLQYSHLLYQKENNTDCYCCCNGCSVGETTNDLESWTSGVYPEDEDYTCKTVDDTVWRSGASNIECTKCLRQ